MSNSKECKFKVGDVVKIVDIDGLYSSENVYGRERLELNKDYPIYSVEDNGKFIKLINNSGETEGVFSYRLIPAEPTTTAESLRNSILSLQQERVSLQEQIEQNIAQEKSLTEQLKELGFLLVESKEQSTGVVGEKKAVLYAEDIEEDMTDSRNWKKGDFVQVALACQSDYCLPGDVFEISGFSKEGWVEVLEDSQGLENSINPKVLKFHSRPVVN